MPRLRNIKSGAVVSCSDETAALLDGEWEFLADEKKTPAKKASSSKSKK